MVTKDYSKSRMRENRTYGSARGGQSNLIPSTRLTRLWREDYGGACGAIIIINTALRRVVGLLQMIGGALFFYKTIQPPWRARENHTTAPLARGNAPLLPPAAASSPEGQICSMLSLVLT